MDNVPPKESETGIDVDGLRQKYRAERDKRLREDSSEQYIHIEGRFSHFMDDPYVEPGFTRAPLTDEVEVLVIGGGFGGLLVAARLRMAGIDNFRIIERGGDFGGTWYWNRYPGAACDVESYIYLPLLEEVGGMPSRKYARAPEILEHALTIAKKFDLYRDVCFQTRVTSVQWDEGSKRWTVRTDRDDAIRARFVVMAAGPLDKPKLPGVPGIETFQRHSFHTSRWDYDYTGGDSLGGLEKLKDKVVGIIGTGATAVQCIPHLGESAKHLYVFQRTPSSIDVRADRLTDPQWADALEPGWQEKRIENFTQLTSTGVAAEDLVMDGWTEIAALRSFFAQKQAAGEISGDPAALMQLADFKKMENIRARVDALVQDKAAAEALKPYYNQFCKRPCFHDEYLQTFNRPNVTLVDTAGKGVERITETGVVANGREYELDCLIYATGFEIPQLSYSFKAGYQVFGRDGVTLTEAWKHGAATLHGFYSHGFPNCFIISHIQSGLSNNFVHMINEQSKHIAYVLSRVREAGASMFEVTREAEEEWSEKVAEAAAPRLAFIAECTPGYYNAEGNMKMINARNGAYQAGPIPFVRAIEAWRAAGDMRGLELTRDYPANQ